MNKFAIVLLGGVLAIGTTFGATLTSLNKAQVQQAFVGKTFKSIGSVNLNGQNVANIFTGTMDAQGNITGQFAQPPANNAPQNDKGTYLVQDDGTLCITWQHWNGAKQECVNTYGTQNAYIMVDTKNMFHTVFLKQNIQ